METTTMTTAKPPIAPTPELAAVMALAMPLVHQFTAEIAKLAPEQQQKRVAKVLGRDARG
jgi:hypothetical protein